MASSSWTSTPCTSGSCMSSFVDVKSPILAESDWFATAWGMHVTFAFTNYAGFLFDLRYDGHELSHIGVTPLPPHVGIEVPDVPGLHPGWDWPGSMTSPQTVVPIAVWISPGQAMQSGMTVNSTSLVPLFMVTGHAKNTTPANNSDIDITISAWQILHIVQSGSYHITQSDWVYKTSQGYEWEPFPGYGHWFHALGTTTTRSLESAVDSRGRLMAAAGYSDLFIHPPYRFRMVDALITNFHLPGTTLLLLVSAFASWDLIKKAYKEAIRGKYRFFSYGDGMLIL